MDAADNEKANEPKNTRALLVEKLYPYLEAQRREVFYAQERDRLCVDLVAVCETGASDAIVAGIARDYIKAKKDYLLYRNQLAVAHQDVSDAWLLWSGGPMDPAQHEYMQAVSRAIDDLREKNRRQQEKKEEVK